MGEAKPKRRGNPNWVKGGPSPNPGGRPARAEAFKERAMKLTEEKVLQAWEDEIELREREIITPAGPMTMTCRGKDWLAASKLAAAYAMGLPTQPIEVTHLTDDELRAELRRMMGEAAAPEAEAQTH